MLSCSQHSEWRCQASLESSLVDEISSYPCHPAAKAAYIYFSTYICVWHIYFSLDNPAVKANWKKIKAVASANVSNEPESKEWKSMNWYCMNSSWRRLTYRPPPAVCKSSTPASICSKIQSMSIVSKSEKTWASLHHNCLTFVSAFQ